MDVHPTKNVSIGIDPYPYVPFFPLCAAPSGFCLTPTEGHSHLCGHSCSVFQKLRRGENTKRARLCRKNTILYMKKCAKNMQVQPRSVITREKIPPCKKKNMKPARPTTQPVLNVNVTT